MTRPASNKSATPSRDDVAREAFRIFQSRNGAPGDPVADWFAAEQIVRSRTTTKNQPRAMQAQAAAGGRNRNGNNRRRRSRR
jgi:hypothetical protein